MVKVLISDSMSPRAEEIFLNRGIEVQVKTGMLEEELIDTIAGLMVWQCVLQLRLQIGFCRQRRI